MLVEEIRQCKVIFDEIDKPENQRIGRAMLGIAGLEEMLKAAQRRIYFIVFIAFGAGLILGSWL